MDKKEDSVSRKRELLIRRKEARDATKDERRNKAFMYGKKFEFIVCPLCLRSRIRNSWKGEATFTIDQNPEVIQVRYAIGGRGMGGFYRKDGEGIRLDELKAKQPNVWDNLKSEIDKLHNLFK